MLLAGLFNRNRRAFNPASNRLAEARPRVTLRRRNIMSIHFISGKPGGGKTLYGMKLLIEELVYGQRLIITNIAVNLGRLNEYLQKKHPDLSIDLRRRMKILSDEQCSEFWKHRRLYLEEHCEMDGIKQVPVDEVGCFFILDELHLFFNARKWMDTGDDCLHYLSQHRKLGDDVICITQHVENVDKQFRSVAQDFTVITNGHLQKIGLFRGLPKFTRRTYSTPPSGLKQEPMETASFMLDAKGVASCYDTAAGIGVHGRYADKGKKRKGLHPLWFVVMLVAACFVVPHILGKVLASLKGVGKHIQNKADAAHPPPASQGDAKQGGVVAPAASKSSEPNPPSQQFNHGESFIVVADRPVVLGKLIRGDGRVRVELSDGRVLENDSDELEAIHGNRVKVSGQWVYYKRPGHGSASVVKTAETAAIDSPAIQLPDPPPAPQSAWQLYSDGVQRLREPQVLGK